MASSPVAPQATSQPISDEEIVSRIIAGEIELFELIMRRYTPRLYRVALSILRDEAEAEDVMENAYVRAYQHLSRFAGRAKFSTWLTRIAVNDALMRKRRSWRCESLDETGENGIAVEYASTMPNPEQVLSRKELVTSLERAILALPENYQVVLVIREVHEFSVAETAECLGISEGNVKLRLYRARAALRKELTRAWKTPFTNPSRHRSRTKLTRSAQERRFTKRYPHPQPAPKQMATHP